MTERKDLRQRVREDKLELENWSCSFNALQKAF